MVRALTRARRKADRRYWEGREVALAKRAHWAEAKNAFVRNGGLPWAFAAGLTAGLAARREPESESTGAANATSSGGVSLTRLILSGISLIRIGQSIAGPETPLD